MNESIRTNTSWFSDYLDGLTLGLFGPFLDKNKHSIHKSKKGAIFNFIIMTILGWLNFAWLFVRRYNVLEYFHGNINSPAKVLAYENNFIFMLEMFAIIFVLMWLFPVILQMILHKLIKKEKAPLQEIAIETAFSVPNFGLFASLVILPMTWGNTFDLFLGISKSVQVFIYLYLWVTIAWGYLCLSFNLSKSFEIPLKLTIIHIWIPIVLLILAVLLVNP